MGGGHLPSKLHREGAFAPEILGGHVPFLPPLNTPLPRGTLRDPLQPFWGAQRQKCQSNGQILKNYGNPRGTSTIISRSLWRGHRGT